MRPSEMAKLLATDKIETTCINPPRETKAVEDPNHVVARQLLRENACPEPEGQPIEDRVRGRSR